MYTCLSPIMRVLLGSTLCLFMIASHTYGLGLPILNACRCVHISMALTKVPVPETEQISVTSGQLSTYLTPTPQFMHPSINLPFAISTHSSFLQMYILLHMNILFILH